MVIILFKDKYLQTYSSYPNRRGGVPVHHFSIEGGMLIE